MGVINDLKKIFFGFESVAKSKYDEVKDKGEDLLDQGIDNLQHKASEMKNAIESGAEDIKIKIESSKTVHDIKSKATDWFEDFSDSTESALKKSEEYLRKAEKSVLGENSENIEKIKRFGGDLGDKISKASDQIGAKINDGLESLHEKADQYISKEQAKEDEENFAKEQGHFQKSREKLKESLLDDKDDFFSKANRWADGDHDAFSEGKIKIDTPNTKNNDTNMFDDAIIEK